MLTLGPAATRGTHHRPHWIEPGGDDEHPAWAHCPACWYDLRGLPIENGRGTCPECGAEFRIALLTRPKIRPQEKQLLVQVSVRERWEQRVAWFTAAGMWTIVGGGSGVIVLMGVLVALRMLGRLKGLGW